MPGFTRAANISRTISSDRSFGDGGCRPKRVEITLLGDARQML
ncbi:hypothetical protein [Microcoleus sp. herbarium12]